MRIDGYAAGQINMDINSEKSKASVNGRDFVESISGNEQTPAAMGSTIIDKYGMNISGDGTLEGLKEKAAMLKDNMQAAFNKMDTGKIVEMDNEGIDINDAEPEKILTVVEQIQIKLAMYSDDFVPTVDIDAKDIVDTLGAGNLAYSIIDKMNSVGMRATKENVSEAFTAVDYALNKCHINDEAKDYLIKNGQAATINNIYMANHSGYVNKAVNPLSETDWQKLKPQMEERIKSFGTLADEQNVALGKFMVENDMDITKETFDRSSEVMNLSEEFDVDFLVDRVVSSMVEGMDPLETNLLGKSLPWEETQKAMETLASATTGNIMAFSAEEGAHNLESLREIELAGSEYELDESDYKYAKTYREIAQARLFLTMDAGRFLEKNGIEVNTTPLFELVEKLKEYELKAAGEDFWTGAENIEPKEAMNRSADILTNIEFLKYEHCAVLGSFTEKESVSLSGIMAVSGETSQKMKMAGMAYEALGTEVRTDLGDSVRKAVVASTEDILNNLGMDDNEASRRAVRILAYNGMEMSEDNINKIKNLDSNVNRVFKKLTPQKTLELIRDGVNPVEMPLDDLESYLEEKNTAKEDIERYSEFLYRLDKKGKITPEEREKFIGIYSLVNKFEKDGMNALGSLMTQGLELSMENLLTAYMTRKDKNIDFTIDDETSNVVGKDLKKYYTTLFKEAKDKITPDFIAGTGELKDVSVEEFAMKAGKNAFDANDPAIEEKMSRYKETVESDKTVYDFLAANKLPATFENLHNSGLLLNQKDHFFGDDYESAEVENRIFDALEDKEKLKKEYSSINQEATDKVRDALYSETERINIEQLKQLCSGMNFVSKMAENNDFFIPYRNEQENGIINLKVIENGENEGRFSIKFNNFGDSKLSIEGQVSKESITVGILYNDLVNSESVMKNCEAVKEQLKNAGFEKVKVNLNRVDEQPEYEAVSLEGVNTREIFKAAKIFVKAFAK